MCAISLHTGGHAVPVQMLQRLLVNTLSPPTSSPIHYHPLTLYPRRWPPAPPINIRSYYRPLPPLYTGPLSSPFNIDSPFRDISHL